MSKVKKSTTLNSPCSIIFMYGYINNTSKLWLIHFYFIFFQVISNLYQYIDIMRICDKSYSYLIMRIEFKEAFIFKCRNT